MVEITEMGSIYFEGNCNGVTFSNKQGTFQKSIMIISLTITLEDYKNIFSLSEQNVRVVPFVPYQMGCVLVKIRVPQFPQNMQSEENCDENSFDILYQGTTTHISLDKNSEVGINDMIAVNQNYSIFSYKIKYTSHICYQQVFRTNMNRISIILENRSFG